jgi:hypothetical protein
MASRHNQVKVVGRDYADQIGDNGRHMADNRAEQVATQTSGLGPVDLMAVAMGVRRPPPQEAPLEGYLANKKLKAKIRKKR